MQQIPMVIKHAMELSHAVGERYLWVDRLCIVQDVLGPGGTVSQVAKMDKIYAGAYMTIIAAAPDRMYARMFSFPRGRIPEWRTYWGRYRSSYDDRNNRAVNYEGSPAGPPKLSRDSITEIMSSRYSALSSSRWATRGWTYQEQILCKRAIIFVEHGFFWDCQCCVWDGGDLVPGQDLAHVPTPVDLGKRFSTRWWPDFSFYAELICPYNGRTFTYPQDAILGISGVLNALETSFPGGFIYGLPRLFLDHALLWQPFGAARRRVDRVDDDIIISSLPSWSWSGWQGYIDPWSLVSGQSYLLYSSQDRFGYRYGSWSTRSLVEWHLSIGNQRSEPVLEPLIFDQHADVTPNVDSDKIPEGWTRHKFYFSHVKDKSIHFKHPIPLKEETSRQPLLSSSAFLECSTTEASFFPATMLKQKGHTSMFSLAPSKISVFENKIFMRRPSGQAACPIVVLQQPNGGFAGLLRLMTSDNIDKSVPFQLIAISTGSAYASDLCRSIEWRLFETGADYYSEENFKEEFYYEPEWISEKGKYALLFDVSMAFNKEAAKNEYVGQELDTALAAVDQFSDEMITKVAATDPEKATTESFRAEKWFQARTNSFLKLTDRDIFRARRSPELPRGQNFSCEFYNVLWIERVEGIAYRRACGWVPKHIWEAHATGPVDVKLG